MMTHIATSEELYEGLNDPYVKLFPFDFKEYKEYQRPSRKLRIGYIESLELIECAPTCRRAIRESVDFLKKQGNELIEVKLPD